MATSTLAGWYVISLRPSGGHASVRRAAAAFGARVLAVSTVKLMPLDARAALAAALASPFVVFTSPAAASFAHACLPLRERAGQRWLAVGSGTANALRQAGIAEVLIPQDRADSEGLLALSVLQSLRDQDVGLVTAPGGRGLIAETLAQRGARIRVAEVYRRVPVQASAARLTQLEALPQPHALLVSSGEAFEGLWSQLADARRERLRVAPVVASSPRLAAMLAAKGFAAIVLADSAAPADLLRALAADVAAGRFR